MEFIRRERLAEYIIYTVEVKDTIVQYYHVKDDPHVNWYTLPTCDTVNNSVSYKLNALVRRVNFEGTAVTHHWQAV